MMLGPRVGTVLEVRPFAIHGVPHVDVSIRYADGSTETARLGSESVPEGLHAGEVVVVRSVLRTVVGIERGPA